MILPSFLRFQPPFARTPLACSDTQLATRNVFHHRGSGILHKGKGRYYLKINFNTFTAPRGLACVLKSKTKNRKKGIVF